MLKKKRHYSKKIKKFLTNEREIIQKLRKSGMTLSEIEELRQARVAEVRPEKKGRSGLISKSPKEG